MNTQVPLRFGIKLPSESIVILRYKQDALKQDRIRSGCSSEKISLNSSGRMALPVWQLRIKVFSL
jgi:hypothetical protein